MAIELNERVLLAAEFVHANYLSTPYTEVGSAWNFHYARPSATKAKGDGHNLQRSIQINGKTLHRPIHGLAHTMRTLMYSNLLHASALRQSAPHVCKNGLTIADLTESDLIKLNIAQLFFVAGRKSEASYFDAYHRYHEYGALYFENFARTYCKDLFSEDEIQLYSRCIADYPQDSFDFSPQSYLMHLSHMIDLMRCKSPVEVFMGNSERGLGIVPQLVSLFGHEDGLDIMNYARGLFEATGEAVFYIDSSEWPHLGAPLLKVKTALEMVGPLKADGIEADADRTANAGFTVAGNYDALTSVPTPEWYHKPETSKSLTNVDSDDSLIAAASSYQEDDHAEKENFFDKAIKFFKNLSSSSSAGKESSLPEKKSHGMQ